jgi:hypothetical protein
LIDTTSLYCKRSPCQPSMKTFSQGPLFRKFHELSNSFCILFRTNKSNFHLKKVCPSNYCNLKDQALWGIFHLTNSISNHLLKLYIIWQKNVKHHKILRVSMYYSTSNYQDLYFSFILPPPSFKFITQFFYQICSSQLALAPSQRRPSGILSLFDLLQKIMPIAYKNYISFLHNLTTQWHKNSENKQLK